MCSVMFLVFIALSRRVGTLRFFFFFFLTDAFSFPYWTLFLLSFFSFFFLFFFF